MYFIVFFFLHMYLRIKKDKFEFYYLEGIISHSLNLAMHKFRESRAITAVDHVNM